MAAPAEPMCAEQTCVLYARPGGKFCVIHETAKRLASVMVGERRMRCRKPLKAGDWVTRESTPMAMLHAECARERRAELADAARAVGVRK